MSRSFVFAAVSVAVSVGGIFGVSAGCDSALDPTGGSYDAGYLPRRDSAPVDPSEGGALVDSGPMIVPSCEKYCGLVMNNCTGDNAQYASIDECLAFCAHLTPVQASRDGEEKHAASVACRQYWADSPARTNPSSYCLAAGPFGGNVCGDRCTAFCDVVLAACAPNDGVLAYGSQPECASACANFSYRDAGADGGGEGPTGPKTGNTLNCRLYHLRSAVKNVQDCALLHPDGGVCEQD